MSANQRILIIDDELAIRSTLKMNLSAEGYRLEEAQTGKGGLVKASEFHPHLIILDLGLPDMDGIEVLKNLRAWTAIPIIILTVTDDEPTKVRLLDAGADDYLTKPFGPSELLARVRVGLRHHGQSEATPIFESGDLKIDVSSKTVRVSEKAIKLTNTEFAVLSCLVREPGKVVPQSQFLKQVWSTGNEDLIHYLRIYINQLRKKIEKNSSQPQHILTEPGIGYRLV